MAGKGKNKARGTPTSGRRVVVVTNGGAPKRLTNTPTTLNERFTQLARKTQGRDAQVQRGTTARYAATMAKRTGLSAKQFQAVPVAVAGKGKKGAKSQAIGAKGVAVGKKLKTVAAVRVTAKARAATKAKTVAATAAPAAKKAKKPKKPKRARPTQQPTQQPTQKQETKVKKPKTKKPKFVKPALPKPEDLDKDLDSYMAAAPDPTLVA